MTDAPSELQPGTTFGRYVIEAVLGVGGMGAVHRARDTQLGRVVALKVVRAGRTDTSGVDPQARLLSEARAVASLRHPNVVAVFDAGVIDGQTFVAMELVEGRPLRAFVADGKVSLDERRRWLVEVAEALSAAHRAGIVHRDVKPENVIIARADRRARVLDFGIAKRVTFDTEAPTSDGAAPQTVEGRVVGTVSYMAPEQLGGSEVSPSWDQYAWGVMAYELLTGKHPRQTVAMPGPTAHLSQTPALPNEIEPRLRFDDVAVIMLAMSSDPQRRFPSMADLIRAWRDGASVKSAPSPVAPTPAPTKGVPRWTFGVAAFAMLAVGLGIGSLSRSHPATVSAAQSAPAAEAPSSPVSIAASTSAPVVLASVSPPPARSTPHSAWRDPITLREDYDTHCQCLVENIPLCPPGTDYHARECQCVADTVLFSDRALTSWHFKARDVAEGSPCRGWDASGAERAGTLASCLPGCPTLVSGIHRSRCRGIESPTGRQVDGVLLCYQW